VSLLWRFATALSVVLSFADRRRYVCPEGSYWQWGEGGGHVVWLCFSPTVSWVTRYHCWALVCYRGSAWLVDPSSSILCLMDMSAAGRNPDRFCRRMGASYVVRCETPDDQWHVAFAAEPMSCVTIMKGLLGLKNPQVQTPEQLLGFLWESRHDRKH
jgi:hypothetical protein